MCMSKDTRLSAAASQMEAGRVFFPEHGTKELLEQILNFGIEKYNDLADAFSALICSIVQNEKKEHGFLGYIREETENVKKENLDPPKPPTERGYLKERLRLMGYFGPLDGIK